MIKEKYFLISLKYQKISLVHGVNESNKADTVLFIKGGRKEGEKESFFRNI